MANYFTQHHFSPRWSTSSHHDAPAEHLSPKSTNPQSPPAQPHPHNNHHDNRAHPSHTHDTVSRFLQALNFHYGPDDYEMVHPHFDMVETKNCYAVYGELPGLSREDIAVEANDHLFTLTISGELKRPVPKEMPEAAVAATIADSEGVGIAHLNKGKEAEPEPAPETAAEPTPDASNTSKAAPPAAQPEAEAGSSEQQEQPKPSIETEATATATPPKDAEQKGNGTKKPEEQQHKEKTTHWHVKERRVGHFKRVFRFPVELVEMANVKANIHHGLLCVIVPKRNDLEAYNRKVEENRKVSVDTFISGPDHTYPLFGYFF